MHTAMWKSYTYSHKRCQYLIKGCATCSAYLTVAGPVDTDAVARAVVRAGRDGRHHVPLAPEVQRRQPPVDLGAVEAAAAEVAHVVLHVEVTPASPVVEDTERDFWEGHF